MAQNVVMAVEYVPFKLAIYTTCLVLQFAGYGEKCISFCIHEFEESNPVSVHSLCEHIKLRPWGKQS